MASTGREGEPAYCQHCGSAVTPGHSYCPDCGGDLTRTRARETGSRGHDGQGSDDRTFWRRVNDYLSRDWRVESNSGDRVVLVSRSVGSLGAHAMLALPTGGLGNLLYGWYEYAHNPDRLVLRADGADYTPGRGHARTRVTSRRTDPTLGDRIAASLRRPLSQFLAGLGLLVCGLVLAAGFGTGLPALLLGLAALVVSVLVLPPTRRRLRERHPPTAFGPTASVEERYVADTDRLCTVCRRRVDAGVVRDYQQEYTLAGVPLYTIASSENYYCESCHVTGESAVDALDTARWTDLPDEAADDAVDRELERE
jgi:hypothetical protein